MGRTVVSRGGRVGPRASAPARVPVPGSMSGYEGRNGYGFNPTNPQAFQASVGAKQYKQSKGTADWDGEEGISPPIR